MAEYPHVDQTEGERKQESRDYWRGENDKATEAYIGVAAERDSARRERDHAMSELARLRAENERLTAARDRALDLCDEAARGPRGDAWRLISDIHRALVPVSTDTDEKG